MEYKEEENKSELLTGSEENTSSKGIISIPKKKYRRAAALKLGRISSIDPGMALNHKDNDSNVYLEPNTTYKVTYTYKGNDVGHSVLYGIGGVLKLNNNDIPGSITSNVFNSVAKEVTFTTGTGENILTLWIHSEGTGWVDLEGNLTIIKI
ncbi:hypothetical protein ABH963_005675 [Bacillus sp. RC55]|uniref:hypothetical protein n=1 Tax=Bacillus sp. RC55 TaxID=3156292 RepID=UPI00383471A4